MDIDYAQVGQQAAAWFKLHGMPMAGAFATGLVIDPAEVAGKAADIAFAQAQRIPGGAKLLTVIGDKFQSFADAFNSRLKADAVVPASAPPIPAPPVPAETPAPKP